MQRFLVTIVLAGCHSSPAETTPLAQPQRDGSHHRTRLALDVKVERKQTDDQSRSLQFKADRRAVVLIDGELEAALNEMSPTTIDVSEGKHRITVEAEGYQRWEHDVDVPLGTVVTYYVH